jgi:hypothetical protein
MGNQMGLNRQPKIILYERSINNRIAEINSFKLTLRDDFRCNRKNVICYSNKLQKYIDTHKLDNNNYEHRRTIAHLIHHDSYYDDIQVISVKGYY